MNQNRNSKKSLLSWARESLRLSDITDADRESLFDVAEKVIEEGGLRGDVCDRWRSHGFSPERIHDLYP